MPVTTRPVDPTDTPFLVELFAGSGEVPALLAATDTPLLQIQFTAQQKGYAAQFPGASHEIILVDAEAAGQIRWTENADEIRIVDVSVLPRFRRQGVAAFVYRAIMARARGRPVRASVARLNRASLDFHARLGFAIEGEGETHVFMRAG